MIISVIKRSLLFLLLALSYGCATPIQYAHGIDYNANNGNCPTDKSCIYVIRPAGLWGAALHFTVSDNKKEIGITGPSSYLAWERDPGAVNLESRAENTVELNFQVDAGQSYYILQSVEPGIISGRNALRFISKDEAARYMATSHPVGQST